MVILALETVTRAGSLALFTDRGAGPAMTGDPARTHGVRLPDAIVRFVQAAGLTLGDIEYFAVVTGPGSFTGLRVGLATIQGLALAGERQVIGIPTLEAIASGWLDLHAGEEGVLVACLDGARGDVFYAAYEVTGAARIEDAHVTIDARVATPAIAAADVAAVRRGGARVTCVGDATTHDASVFLADVPGARMGTPMPNLAAAAARLAARRVSLATPPHALRPIYVRRPDAELARERAAREFSVFEVKSAGDVAEVAALQARAFSRAWGAEALGGEQGSSSSVARLYAVRHRSGTLVAYCACWQIVDELHINSLAVDPPYRRQGVARTLLGRVFDWTTAAGVTAATLEVRESNVAGRALYEGFGFQVEGVRPGYYEQPREDALVLWRRGLRNSNGAPGL